MAGDWIKMRTNLKTHPKVVRISSALKADRLRVVGGLHAVWCLFDDHSEDGILEGYTFEALDDLIGFPGFSVALADVGWLESADDHLVVPRFDEHNGQSAKRRAQETQRKRESRSVSAPDADNLRSREEKRREEKKQTPASAGFDSFWKSWPATDRKTAKAKCAEKWVKGGFESMSAGIVAHVETMKATNKQWIGGYEPAPLTYLTQQRWQDAEGGPDSWWLVAGFETQWDALNGGCTEHNAKFFKDGHREGVPA